LYSLAQHPEYQTKAQEELDRIIGDRNTDYFDWYVLYLDYLNTPIQNGASRPEKRSRLQERGCHGGHDCLYCMVVEFKTACAISAYHH